MKRQAPCALTRFMLNVMNDVLPKPRISRRFEKVDQTSTTFFLSLKPEFVSSTLLFYMVLADVRLCVHAHHCRNAVLAQLQLAEAVTPLARTSKVSKTASSESPSALSTAMSAATDSLRRSLAESLMRLEAHQAQRGEE
eukprot:6202885-Pleurochrysis_carterae.AAC.1